MLSALFRKSRATTTPAPERLPVLDAADTPDAMDAAAWVAGRRDALRELVAERGRSSFGALACAPRPTSSRSCARWPSAP